MINAKLCTAAEYVRNLGYTPVYVSLHGSQNYGLDVYTDTYQSDYDFKCIVLPTLWDLAEGKRPASQTVDIQDGQIDIKDIRVFMDSVVKMNPAYLESLETTNAQWFPGGERMESIRALLPALMHDRAALFAHACEGLFEDKRKRLCHDSPAVHERIARYGYDGKQAHHMYRLLVMLRELEKNGQMRLTTPESERKLLTDLKLNRYGLEEVLDMIAQWRAELQALCSHIEVRFGEPKDAAAQEMIRLSREMIVEHCRREAHDG